MSINSWKEEVQSPALRSKYQKLLEAYQKCKKESQLLRKALIADQETHKFHESVIKEKEVLLRSSVEENDMLTFNNQRLTRRVEQLILHLQEEKKNVGAGWGSFFSGSTTEIARLNSHLEVSQEQLGQKLDENEGLVSQMCELRSENEQTVAMLDKKLSEFKAKVKEKEDEYEGFASTNDQMQAELNDQKNALNQRLSMNERELEQTRTLMQEREQTMTTINRQLSTDLERTQHLFDHKVAFDDTRVTEYNKMNIPGFDRVLMLRKIEIAEQALGLFETFSRTFRAHDQAYVDRLNLMGRNLSAMSKLQRVNEKISQLLPEHQVHIRNLEKEFRTMVIRMKSVLDVKLLEELEESGGDPGTYHMSALFKRLVFYHNKMLPYQVLSLMEEARKDTCVPVLQARNYVLVSTQKRLTAALDKLCVYVQLACPANSSNLHSRAQEANAPAILKYSHSAATAMHQAFQAYTSHLISKISQEHRAPFVLPELKMVNEKVLNSLSTLVTTIAKLVELLGNFVSISSTPAGYTIRGVECDPLQMSEDIPYMQQRARKFVALIQKTHSGRAERVPYSEAVRAKKELASVDENRAEWQARIDQAELATRNVEDQLAQVSKQLAESESQNELLQAEMKALTAALASYTEETVEQVEEEVEEEQERRISVASEERRPSAADLSEVIQLKMILTQRDEELADLRSQLQEFEQMSHSPAPVDSEANKPDQEGLQELRRGLDKMTKQRNDATARCKEETTAHARTVTLLAAQSDKQTRADELSLSMCSSSMLDEMERQLRECTNKSKPTSKQLTAPIPPKQGYGVSITDENGRRLESSLLSGDRRSREDMLQTFYRTRLCQLVSQVQLADQISLDWQTEHNQMKTRHDEMEQKAIEMESKLLLCEQRANEADTELRDRTQTYEKQVKKLTENISSLKQQVKNHKK
eukprot:TRINITY_DN10762_c0_g2_i1.p1 TRINITY_DN10762_c0_g2~~TRINITY_DN10762_c0_g2_i1.p1  ORF type:complete len:930 (+),score=259.29 TRINITY_DN10762_c0_g2_i1:130-2919(+)